MAATDFAALRPWEHAADCHTIGLMDPITGQMRIGHVLGNAGEVFAAVFYRRGGLRWILSLLGEQSEPPDLHVAEGMDGLKLEFVPKRELLKEDLALLKALAFKPAGKGPVWPQFRSAEPGWHPWHLNQEEADQLLVDLPRLTTFCRLFEQHPDLYDNRDATEIPFLPVPIPDRPLTLKDLDWRPLPLPPLTGLEPFQADPAQLEQLRALKRESGLACEFECTLLPGGSFYENDRPCYGRFSLLVERQNGMLLGLEVASGALPPGEAAGRSLVKTLIMGKTLPEKILIAGSHLQTVLQPLCDTLQIQLRPATALPALEEAFASLSQHLLGRRMK